jgi:hypothetical protein
MNTNTHHHTVLLRSLIEDAEKASKKFFEWFGPMPGDLQESVKKLSDAKICIEKMDEKIHQIKEVLRKDEWPNDRQKSNGQAPPPDLNDPAVIRARIQQLCAQMAQPNISNDQHAELTTTVNHLRAKLNDMYDSPTDIF